jgi:hypothetical protein
MALINCKECGNAVSDSAKSCPQCGVKIAGGSGFGTMAKIGIAVFILFIIITANAPNYNEAVDKSKADLATSITQGCASEAGIPTNDPQHKITLDEMNRMTACVDRSLANSSSKHSTD